MEATKSPRHSARARAIHVVGVLFGHASDQRVEELVSSLDVVVARHVEDEVRALPTPMLDNVKRVMLGIGIWLCWFSTVFLVKFSFITFLIVTASYFAFAFVLFLVIQPFDVVARQNLIEITRRREKIKFLEKPEEREMAEKNFHDFIDACTPRVDRGSCRACNVCKRTVWKVEGCDNVKCECGFDFDFASAKIVDVHGDGERAQRPTRGAD